MHIPGEVQEILDQQKKENRHFDGMLDGETVFKFRTSYGIPLMVLDDLLKK